MTHAPCERERPPDAWYIKHVVCCTCIVAPKCILLVCSCVVFAAGGAGIGRNFSALSLVVASHRAASSMPCVQQCTQPSTTPRTTEGTSMSRSATINDGSRFVGSPSIYKSLPSSSSFVVLATHPVGQLESPERKPRGGFVDSFLQQRRSLL